MKNFILSLVLVFSLSAVAQKQASQEEVRATLAQGMVSLVESIKPAYKSGMTFDQFQTVLTGAGRPTAEGTALLTKAYQYISTNTSAMTIQSTYSGKEFAGAHLKIESLKQNKSTADGTDLFGITSEKNAYHSKNSPFQCQWWNLPCHIAAFVSWVADNHVTICLIAGIMGFPCP